MDAEDGSLTRIERRLRNLVISGYGVRIGREGRLILVDDGNVKERISPRGLEQLVVFGNCSITSEAVRYLSREGVDIIFVDEKHDQFLRVVDGSRNPLKELWRHQLILSDERRLELAKEIVRGGLYNKRRLLLQFKSEDILRIICEELKRKFQSVNSIESKKELMGLEGDGSRVYWEAWKLLVPEPFSFSSRKKHPPPDAVNSMLGYGYTVLRSRVEYALLRAGLNPYIGLLHQSYRDRPALAFDLMEPFRSVIVDRVVMTLLRRGTLTPEDFEEPRKGVIHILGEGKRVFLDRLYSRMESEHLYGGKKYQFLDIMFLQAEELGRAIAKGEEFRTFRYR